MFLKRRADEPREDNGSSEPAPAEIFNPLARPKRGSAGRRFVLKRKYLALNLLLAGVLLGLIVWSQSVYLFRSPEVSELESSAFKPLDALSSSEIAHAVAVLGHYRETTWIQTQTYNSRSITATGALPVVAKPVIINSTVRTRKDIVHYVVSQGDTVLRLANDFSLAPDSIRWSNGLKGNSLPVGQTVLIPPVGLNGIVYQIKEGDTLDSLKQRYNFSSKTLLSFNDIEDLSDLEAGEFIFMPSASLATVKSVPHFLDQATQQYRSEISSILGVTAEDCRGCIPVKAGDVIGQMGNTGWSTGPHLHLEVWTIDGRRHNPRSFLHQNSLLWPVRQQQRRVTQNYHSGHPGLDIGEKEGADILAIDEGQIIYRGCMFNYNYATFGVLIDHGSYYSLSIHLQAPNNDLYKPCSINRRSQYGQPSIDYSTNL